MIIKSITLNNYRLYGGDNTIVFNNKEDKNGSGAEVRG